MKTLSGLLCIMLGSAVLADTITTPGGVVIDGADVKSVIVATKFPVTVTAPAGGVLYQWDVPASVKTKRTKGASLVVDEAAPGDTVLSVTYAVVDFEKKTVEERTATVTFTAGGVQPPPVPPQPPTPPPSPAPIPVAGLHVLVVYETAEVSKMPAEQAAIIFGKTFRDTLNSKCVVGPDGRTREWRIWDKDIATSGDAKLWQDAMARPRNSSPWIIVSNGKAGFEGPLPANTVEATKLVNQYAE